MQVKCYATTPNKQIKIKYLKELGELKKTRINSMVSPSFEVSTNLILMNFKIKTKYFDAFLFFCILAVTKNVCIHGINSIERVTNNLQICRNCTYFQITVVVRFLVWTPRLATRSQIQRKHRRRLNGVPLQAPGLPLCWPSSL